MPTNCLEVEILLLTDQALLNKVPVIFITSAAAPLFRVIELKRFQKGALDEIVLSKTHFFSCRHSFFYDFLGQRL